MCPKHRGASCHRLQAEGIAGRPWPNQPLYSLVQEGCGVPPKLQGLVLPSKAPSYPLRHLTAPAPRLLTGNKTAGFPFRVESYSLQTMTPLRSSRLHSGASCTLITTTPNYSLPISPVKGSPRKSTWPAHMPVPGLARSAVSHCTALLETSLLLLRR